MEKQDFKVSVKTVSGLAIGNFIFSIVSGFANFQHWESSVVLLTIYLILCISTFIIVLSDIIKNKVYNKTFWVMSMFILPTISPFYYIVRRNKLIQHESKLVDRISK